MVTFLRGRRVLLIFDSCEHVLGAAAALAEAILRGTSEARVLATSREPLRAEGESVLNLDPLEAPPETATLTARQAMAFPAVELFIERASSTAEDFEVTDETVPIVSNICRKLDGMALAIELAAGRVHTFGLHELATQLDDRFRLLMQGRRTALPRHRTLTAALDWSYQYLDRTEQAVLRRLAIFVGGFTLEAAQAVAIGDDDETSDVVRALADLVAKSLISVNAKGQTPIYRLLDTTRAYAMEKLVESGEFSAIARLHAAHYRVVLVRAGGDAETMVLREWLSTYARQVDNVRRALDWAFSADGDPMLGVALTEAALPLWMHLSLMNECRSRVAQSLSILTSRAQRNPRLELQFQHALGAVLLNIEASGPEIETALNEALRIADDLNDTDYKLRILWCLWCLAHNCRCLPRRPGPCRPVLRDLERSTRSRRSLDRGAHAGIYHPLSRRPARGPPPDRVHARQLCRAGPSRPYHPFPVRPEDNGPQLPGLDPLAPRLRQPGAGDERSERRRGAGLRPHDDAVQFAGQGRLPVVAASQRSARRTAIY